MRVLAQPAANDGCRTWRMDVPSAAAKAVGLDIRVTMSQTYECLWEPRFDGDHVVGVRGSVGADVVIIQRPLRRSMYELMKALQARDVAVVIEVDDDFHALAAHNPAFKIADPANDPTRNRDWLMRSTEEADWVTVTTPALKKRYGAHGRCSIISNYLPDYVLDIPKYRNSPPLIGWSGWVGTHGGDLRVPKGALRSVLEASGALFHVVGEATGVAERLGIDHVSATGWLDERLYMENLATLDIGIVPLQLTKFNEAKSNLKGSQMAAVGLPVVASPTGPYRQLAELGGCSIATNAEEWHDELMSLVLDPERREWRGLAAKAVAEEHLMIRDHVDEWISAWEHAANHRAS